MEECKNDPMFATADAKAPEAKVEDTGNVQVVRIPKCSVKAEESFTSGKGYVCVDMASCGSNDKPEDSPGKDYHVSRNELDAVWHTLAANGIGKVANQEYRKSLLDSIGYFSGTTNSGHNPALDLTQWFVWLEEYAHDTGMSERELIRLAQSRTQGLAKQYMLLPKFLYANSWYSFKCELQNIFGRHDNRNEVVQRLMTLWREEGQSPRDFANALTQANLHVALSSASREGLDESVLLSHFISNLNMPDIIHALRIKSPQTFDEAVKFSHSYYEAARPSGSGSGRAVLTTSGMQGHYSPDTGSTEEPGMHQRPFCAFCRGYRGHITFACRRKPRGRGCWTCGDEGHTRSHCQHGTEQGDADTNAKKVWQ